MILIILFTSSIVLFVDLYIKQYKDLHALSIEFFKHLVYLILSLTQLA